MSAYYKWRFPIHTRLRRQATTSVKYPDHHLTPTSQLETKLKDIDLDQAAGDENRITDRTGPSSRHRPPTTAQAPGQPASHGGPDRTDAQIPRSICSFLFCGISDTSFASRVARGVESI